ncbi:MAG: hypothetical protein V4773_09885 [Verrucomicrobiota bacterium]
MSKLYIIAPCVLLLGFSAFERVAHRQHDARIERRAAERLAGESAAAERHAALKAQAEIEARERTLARQEQERAREAARLREHEATVAGVDGHTAAHRAEISQLARELDQLHTQLTALRVEKDSVETAVFDLARNVEQKRIDRRVVEIEIQRTTKMVATQLLAPAPKL